MSPEPSPLCDHPDDEWCDDCFIPTRHVLLLRAVEADAGGDPHQRALVDEYLTATRRDMPRVLPPDRCVNRRHTHGRRAYKDACYDTTVPPYPLIHRAVGSAALGIAGAAALGVVLGWKIGEALSTLREWPTLWRALPNIQRAQRAAHVRSRTRVLPPDRQEDET